MVFWVDKIAKEIVKREKDLYRTECGLGASGIPHIGSVGDGIRSYVVTLALEDLGVESEFQAFSDDRDGLRKVPINFPKEIRKYIGFPVSNIPDPFNCHESFRHHTNSLLIEALENIGVKFKFQSGSEAYSKGMLDSEIVEILSNWKMAGEIIKEITGQEKYLNQLPYFAVCENCGRIYTTRVYEFLRDEKKVRYKCDSSFVGGDSATGEEILIKGCGYSGVSSIRDGKLAWKVEFACRWRAFDISFEAYGKEILDSVKVNDEISKRILKFEPPVHAFYELFVERGGKRISKSRGNVFTPQIWLSYGSPESLRLLMLKRLAYTRVVDVLEVPKLMDEVDYLAKVYHGAEKVKNKREERHLKRMYEYVCFLNPPKELGLTLSYFILVNILKVIPKDVENRYEIVKEILTKSKKIPRNLTPELEEELLRRMDYASEWVEEVEVLERKPLEINERERKALLDLKCKLSQEMEAQKIQETIFDIARSHGINAANFFKLIYRLILGVDRGPKASTLIKIVGQENVSKMIEDALKEL